MRPTSSPFSRLRRRGRRSLIASATAALLVVPSLGLLPSAAGAADAPAVPVVTNISGLLTVRAAHGSGHDVSSTALLHQGDVVMTGIDALAAVSLSGTGKVRLGPGTTAQVFRSRPDLAMRLTSGALCVNTESAHVTIATAAATLSATSPKTDFNIENHADGTKLAVYRGTVAAMVGGKSAGTLKAGEAASASVHGAFRKLSSASLAQDFAGLHCPQDVAVAQPSPTPQPAPAAGPDAPAGTGGGGGGGAGGIVGILLGLAAIGAAAGHGGGGGGNGNPTSPPSIKPTSSPTVPPTAPPTVPPTPGILTVNPATLSFTTIGPGNDKNFVASETNYTGTILALSADPAVAVVTPAAGAGPNQTFSVTPVGAGSTTITVTDTRGQTATVTVNVAPSGALSVNPGSLVFNGGGAGAQTFDASEVNYTGPIFANGCNGVATVSPHTGKGQSQQFTVTPTAAGTCTITVTDNHGGVQTVSVTVYGPLTVNPASLTFNAIGEQQPLSASEAFYTGGFTVDAAACAGIATVSGSGPSFTVTAVGSGSCDLTVRDNHNGSRAVHVTVLAAGPLSVNPNPITFTDVGLSNAADVTVSESHYVGAFSVTNNTCSAIATIGSPSSGGPTATISVTPLSTPSGGTCTFNVTDDHGGTVTETVTVGPFGPVSPNPNSFNISVGQTVPLTITESNYTGRFTQTGCAGIAKLSGTRPNYTIMGLAPGTCTFTISDDHGQSASISVTVTAVLTVNPTSVTVSTGTSATFTASDPSCAPGDTVTATSADVTIAVVTPVGPQDCSAGPVTFTVTGVSPTPAQTTISVTDTKGGSASVGVGVNGPPPAAAKHATRASHPIVAPNGPRKPLPHASPQGAPASAPLVLSMPAVNLIERGPAQSIDVSESAYAGAFHAQSSDPSALSVTPQCGGPICSLRVTPLKEGAGTIRISDDRGSVRTIGFSVTAAKPTAQHATPPRPPMPLPSPAGAAPAPRPKPTPSPPH